MIGEKDYSMVCPISYLTLALKHSEGNVKKFGRGRKNARAIWIQTYQEM
jgi:hypothetical protein